jgi:hypothetical protein
MQKKFKLQIINIMAERDKNGKFIKDLNKKRIPRWLKKLMPNLHSKRKRLMKLKNFIKSIAPKESTKKEEKQVIVDSRKSAVTEYLQNRQIEKAIRAEEIEQSYMNRQRNKEKKRLKHIA